MIDNMKVGTAISSLRQAMGLTQQQLAATLNVSHQAVSKWETGQALPDVQTLMALTGLFGVTMEQLLSGEIPPERLQTQSAPSPDPLNDIGKRIKGVFDGIGDFFSTPKRSDTKSIPKTDAQEAEEADAEAPQGKPEDDEADAEAPQSKPEDEASSSEPTSSEQTIDFQKLLSMAPFMSKSALEKLVEGAEGLHLTTEQIVALAPFLSRECLGRLIMQSNGQINWEMLRRLAPFLSQDIVDRLTLSIVKGQKIIRPAAEDFARSMDNLGREIGKGVDVAVRKAVKFGESVFGDIASAFADAQSHKSSRPAATAEEARKMVFQKALSEGKWDWLAAHIEEISDESLLHEIAQTAYAAGMADWVSENLPDEAESVSAMDALRAGNWDLLGEIAEEADPETQAAVAAAAVKAGRWDWLTEHVSDLDLGEYACDVAIAAYQAGQKPLAISMTEEVLDTAQAQRLARVALENADVEFLVALSDNLDDDFLEETCVALANANCWDAAAELAEHAQEDVQAQLLQMAVEHGDWEIIDRLDALLR